MWKVSRLMVVFGLLGLVPFIAGAVGVWVWSEHATLMTHYFILYSAGILTFMAGIYWPLSMQLEPCTYPISSMSALLLSQGFFVSAAVGILVPDWMGALLFPALFALLFLTDYLLLRSYWPKWYLPFRGLLTGIAVACQVAVAVALMRV